MGAPLWTQEEKDCFVNFIIPRSQFASGQYDAATGLTWKEHAPIMEVEMTRRGGYPELRVYTENALSQLYYNRFSARAVSRGQSDMTMMRASPRKSQPPSRSSTASVSRDIGPPQHPSISATESGWKAIASPPAAQRSLFADDIYPRNYVSLGRRPRSRYVTRFTQTDPQTFLGFSPEETLSVHADPIGQASHELTSGGNGSRSGRNRGEMYQPARKVGSNRGQTERLGGVKRGYNDYEEEEIGEFKENMVSRRMTETEWAHRNYNWPSLGPDVPSSNNATYGDDELPDYEHASRSERSSQKDHAQHKDKKFKPSFTVKDLNLSDQSDEDMTSLLRGPKSARPIEADENARSEYSKVQSRWEDLQNDERRKRQKTKDSEVKEPSDKFAVSKLDDFSDVDSEIDYEGPLRGQREADLEADADDDDEIYPDNKSAPSKTAGMMVEGIYRPTQSRGFGIAPLESTKFSPPRKSSSARNKTSDDTPAKFTAPSSSRDSAIKKNVQKRTANPSPAKDPAVKKSKKAQSKMTNKLPQTTSKHPIEYTNRQVPFFESVNLPKIPKRSAAARSANGGDLGSGDRVGGLAGVDFGDRDGYSGGEGHRVPAGSVKRPGRSVEDHRAGGEREVAKISSSDSYRARDKDENIERIPGLSDNGIKSRSANDTLSRVIADSASTTISAAPRPAAKAHSIPRSEASMTEKFATLESIVARATKETRPEDAAPWAKAIAAKRGFRDSVSPVEDEVGAKDTGSDGKEKTDPLEKK